MDTYEDIPDQLKRLPRDKLYTLTVEGDETDLNKVKTWMKCAEITVCLLENAIDIEDFDIHNYYIQCYGDAIYFNQKIPDDFKKKLELWKKIIDEDSISYNIDNIKDNSILLFDDFELKEDEIIIYVDFSPRGCDKIKTYSYGTLEELMNEDLNYTRPTSIEGKYLHSSEALITFKDEETAQKVWNYYLKNKD